MQGANRVGTGVSAATKINLEHSPDELEICVLSTKRHQQQGGIYVKNVTDFSSSKRTFSFRTSRTYPYPLVVEIEYGCT
jgi:hypothetical protein